MAEPETTGSGGVVTAGLASVEQPVPPENPKAVRVFEAVVRPYVTVLFATTVAAGWLMGRLSDDAFLGVASMAIGFWFIQRQSTKTPS